MSKPLSQQAGSLLLNVMLSMAITALMLTLAMPSIRQFQANQKITASMRGLAGDLRLAQQLTISEQVPYYVALSTSSNSYGIYRTGSSTAVKTVFLDSSLSFDTLSGLSPNAQIIYNPYGSVAQAGSITVKNSSNSKKTVNIKPSGYVELLQ